jgi:uncharacterized LabA/DUF88 family protein
MFKHLDQRVGVFIDTQNMYYSARYLFGRRVSFGNIVEDAVAGRRLIRAMAYVVKTKTADETPFFEALKKLGIELREKELMEYLSGQKKADWDVGLAIDAVRMLDMLDVVILVTGDGDFVPLIEFAKSRGRIVEVMGFRETTSSKLVEAADEYTNLSDNKRRFLIGPTRRPSAAGAPRGGEVLEEKAGDDEDDPGGYFMRGAADREENRDRRMEF